MFSQLEIVLGKLSVFALQFLLRYSDTVAGEEAGPLPSFVSQPQTIRVVAGDTVQIPCFVQNLGQYTLVWKHGTHVLTAGELKITFDKRISLVNGFSLQIRDAHVEDSGSYVCQLSTYKPQTLVHTLNVLVPPKVKIIPSHVEARKGDTIILECLASGNPAPIITWTRLNNSFLSNGKPSLISDSYTIHHADRHQAGVYRCTGENGVGIPVSTQVQVKVEYAPEILIDENWIHAGENQDAVLICHVYANPPAVVHWYRDNTPLDEDTHNILIDHISDKHTLKIRSVQVTDFANYTCEALNKLGKSSSTIELSGKPNRAVIRSDPVGRFKHLFNITWAVESQAPVEEHRLYYRRKTAGESGSGLPWIGIILPAGPGESSSLYARNAISLRAANASGENVEIQKSYQIRNLDPGTTYEAKVATKNRFGWGEISELFQFKTRSIDTDVYDMKPAASSARVYSQMSFMFHETWLLGFNILVINWCYLFGFYM